MLGVHHPQAVLRSRGAFVISSYVCSEHRPAEFKAFTVSTLAGLHIQRLPLNGRLPVQIQCSSSIFHRFSRSRCVNNSFFAIVRGLTLYYSLFLITTVRCWSQNTPATNKPPASAMPAFVPVPPTAGSDHLDTPPSSARASFPFYFACC